MNKKRQHIITMTLLAALCLPAAAQTDSTALTGNAFIDQISQIVTHDFPVDILEVGYLLHGEELKEPVGMSLNVPHQV